MPARKRRLSRLKSKNKKRFNLKVPVVILLALSFFPIYLFKTSYFWDGKNKTSIVINQANGDIRISIFDPKLAEIINLDIPANTEVEVARRLGRIQIKNVWQLGENEGLDGRLLSETLTYHFRFPVSAWADHNANGLSEAKLGSIINAVLMPYKTNLGMGDKVRIALFSLGVKNLNRVEINLAESSYLKKTVLTSGEEGYLLGGSFPERLLIYFADSQISAVGATVLISDATSSPDTAEKLGEIIEVLGAKVAAIESEEVKDFDCDVMGKNPVVVEKVAKLFSCTETKESTRGNFDLEITIGEKFFERF